MLGEQLNDRRKPDAQRAQKERGGTCFADNIDAAQASQGVEQNGITGIGVFATCQKQDLHDLHYNDFEAEFKLTAQPESSSGDRCGA